MRTMFVSRELNPCKKKFQKPNILRRRSKASVQRPDISHVNVPSQVITSVTQSENLTENSLLRLQVEILRPEITTSFQTINDNVQKYILPNNIKEETEVPGHSFGNNIDNISFDNNVQVNGDEDLEQDPLNIESFLNSTIQLNSPTGIQKNENVTKNYWCHELINESKDIIWDKCNSYDGSQMGNVEHNPILSDPVPPTAMFPVQNLTTQNNISTTTESPSQNMPNNGSMNVAAMIKCNKTACKKGFWCELTLKKNKDTHNKKSNAKVSQIAIECPVKKPNEEGEDGQCGRIHFSTEDLLKHLNEDHTPDDAIFRCSACGDVPVRGEKPPAAATRRRVRAARGQLRCLWPGCGREFRLPCRLREHARAHTGDRPYPCLFPNCGWSFRSASKLLRHGRRHTGERRHVCAACGRAFHRREHLRDHCARTHPDCTFDGTLDERTDTDIRACTYPECEETFTSANALHVHTRKMHKKADSRRKDGAAAPRKGRGNMFVMNLAPESQDEGATNTSVSETVLAERSIIQEMEMENAEEASRESGGSVAAEEWHSARTHCTWPLADRHRPLYEHALESAYVLEEDVPAEQSENSENNVYTIRSDLFLHGNVLINEDSEFIVSREVLDRVADGLAAEERAMAESVGEGGEDAGEHSAEHVHTLDAGLDLIDAHPTIDLMQEELMYADTAVDESSFRVFFT